MAKVAAAAPVSAPPPVSRLHLLALLFLALAYAVPVVSCWNMGYLDFGDGNYMYISWRVSQGAMLYRDILAPQPPLHLYLGAAIAWLGDHLLPHPIWAFRTFSLLLHLATMLLVWATSRRIYCLAGALRQANWLGVISAAVYLVMPIGFWWTLGYQSQPLLIILLLTMFYGVIRNNARWVALAGLAGGLGLLTNMTTAPYVLFTAGWLLLRRPRHGLVFTLLAAALPILVIPAMEAYTHAYISNVVKNQVGAFPRADVLAQSNQTVFGYVFEKLQTEGGDVLRLEGTWTALGILGMLIFGLRRRATGREYILYFSFFSLCCIFYVAKGGTVDYVFSLAEPYVAIFAALPVLVAAHSVTKIARSRGLWRDFSPIAGPLLGAALVVVTMMPGVIFMILTLQQKTYELNEADTLNITNLIRLNTKPDDEIIAPPHLAFITRRKIAQDYSEHFLWRLKYMNERLDEKPGRAVATINALAGQLRRKELPFLVLDMNQTGTIPEIKEAVEANYHPLMKEPLRTLNTPLQFYRPN